MTNEQFELIVKLIRGTPDSPATKAARMVLVEGIKQKEASDLSGSSPSNVKDAVVRYKQIHEQILNTYSAQLINSTCNYSSIEVSLVEDAHPHVASTRSNNMQTELKVDYHPSGRHTLKERAYSDRNWKDVNSIGLIANQNARDFYARVQAYIDVLNSKGTNVSFVDCSEKPASDFGIVVSTVNEKPILTLDNIDWDKVAKSPEPAVVDVLSQLLQERFWNIHTTEIAWLAYREQILIAHAREIYGKASKADIAIHWAQLARQGRLKVSFDLSYGLKISE